MILKTFILGSLENNNYVLIDEKSPENEAILIDCTNYSDEIESFLTENNAKLKYIILTHGHFDHVLGINAFKEKYPDCKVLAHEDDKELLDSIVEFAKKFALGSVEVQNIDEFFKDDAIIKFGSEEVKVIHTPGHTKGGVCFLVGNNLFSGDTLFYESVGRTDLPGGSFDQLKSSIENKLFTLDECVRVFPGHGFDTTIKHEKENNRFL